MLSWFIACTFYYTFLLRINTLYFIMYINIDVLNNFFFYFRCHKKLLSHMIGLLYLKKSSNVY